MTRHVGSTPPVAHPNPRSPAHLLALGGVVAPLLFLTVCSIAGALRPDYSHVGQFISDLGATGSSNAALMNYGGFVPVGLLFVAFGISLGSLLPRHVSTLVGAVLIVLVGVGIGASGLLSCDQGCPHDGGSLENVIHNRIGPITFVTFIVAIAVLGVRFRSLASWRGLSLYSLATSAVALGFLIALAGSLETRSHTGLSQRLLLAALFLWSAIVGLRVFGVARTTPANESAVGPAETPAGRPIE